jgi:hypothetical protein
LTDLIRSAAGVDQQLHHAAGVDAAAFLQHVQVVVDDAQHPGWQVSPGTVLVRLGRDVCAAEQEIVGQPGRRSAGPGQAHGPHIDEEPTEISG